MAFSCGCQIVPGGAVPVEVVKEHYKHTIEVMLFWELLQRPDTPPSDEKIELSQLRIEYLDRIEKLYPEAKID